jgi:hypothetical protein
METGLKGALRLASSVCLVALAACSSGGGGGASLNTTSNNSTGSSGTSGNTTGSSTTSGSTTSNTTPTVSIGAPDPANASISTTTYNFTTNLPPVGTVFGLLGPAVKVTSTTVSAANAGTNGTLTYRGLSNGVPTFDINIPALNLSVTNVPANTTPTPVSGGGGVLLGIGALTYTAAGVWSYAVGPGSGITYVGATASGSGTPIANVPVAGTATYSGSGGAGSGTVGIYFIPNGNGGITTGALTGNITVAVNFGSGAVNGSLSNMTAMPGDGSAATPWNNVSLSGNINRLANNASFTGTTSTSGAPAGAGSAGFTSAATGGIAGGFFGPNVNEVGGTWTLTDPNAAGGGETAFGAFGAQMSSSSGLSGSSGSTSSTPSIVLPSIGVTGFTTPGTNFTTNPPPVGSSIPLGGGTVAITSTSVADANITQASATYRGTVTTGSVTYPVFDLSIPALSLTASNVRGDGTPATTSTGGQISAAFTTMTYTLLGAWSYVPPSGGTSYLSQIDTGYATPASGVPTSGSASYSGTAASGTGVAGAYAVPSGSGTIQTGTLSGDASLSTNFASNSFTGSFTNMQAQASGSSTTTPWNSVSLNGTLVRQPSGAVLQGTTSTTGAPAGAGTAGFSSAATGTVVGQFNGPTAQEVGGIWTLSESAIGGKTAFGTFGVK